MNRALASIAVIAALVPAWPGSAFAACETQGRAVCGKGPPKVSSEGKLTVSRGGGFAPFASNAGVRNGDRILTGAVGTTVALGPACTTTVGAGSLVSFTTANGRTCATVTGSAQATVTAPAEPLETPTRDIARLPPAAIGVGVAAAAAVAVGIGLAVSGGGSNPPATVSAQ